MMQERLVVVKSATRLLLFWESGGFLISSSFMNFLTRHVTIWILLTDGL